MSTVFVTLCDPPYLYRVVQTVKDLRGRGGWKGDIVLIAVDFEPDTSFLETYNVKTVSFPRFDLTAYLDRIKEKRFSCPTNDGRELTKTTQWEKLHAFEPYFSQWDRVVFIDAGLRVLNSIAPLLDLEWKERFLSPDDTYRKSYRFSIALELENWPTDLESAIDEFSVDLDGTYFLNCIWVYDTSLAIGVSEFLECLKYPIWRHNEMGAMNAVLHFQHKLWSPFPIHAATGKYLFEWSESNNPGTKWEDYHLLKYPSTIGFD